MTAKFSENVVSLTDSEVEPGRAVGLAAGASLGRRKPCNARGGPALPEVRRR